MQLQLKYQENAGQPVLAAFVPGQLPGDWLREINSWQIGLQGLACYPVPQSISANQCAGLLVVFDPRQCPRAQLLRNPYTCVADKLYIPLNAALYPVIGADELKTLLLWDIQLFHPVIGLVGFERKDEIKLSSFINLPQPTAADWSFAHPGVATLPVLQQIGLEAAEAPEDIMEEMKEDVGSKPLQDIPYSNESESAFVREGKKSLNVLAKIGLYVLLGFAMIGKILFWVIDAIFPRARIGGNFSDGSRYSGKVSGGGLIQKAENWLNEKLEELEKKRDSELKRLMKLFDDDTDEALQYAIPLGSSYLNRGTAPPSATLNRRLLNFNIGNLGGGGRVDAWDIGNYEYELRKRYEKAANDAITKGNFKRAAYIYAHLLNNFYSAANVLQQGKFYREAAAIYKNHVKNERMAAECLEKGGLLSEAIPLYINLEQFEKVGDLYRQMGKDEKAGQYFLKTVDILKTAKDYQKAASVTLEKMNRRDEALALLMEGWKDTNQPEACLTTYLQVYQQGNEANSLPLEVNRLYNNHVSRLKRTSFLNVLTNINRNYPNEQLEESSLNIAYEIVHQQVVVGDVSGLKLMGNFLPGDKLLNADTTRFIQNRVKMPPVNTTATYLQLRNDTRWFSLITYHDQLLGIGLKKNDVNFMRANWEGKINYQFLYKGEPGACLLAEPGFSDQALLVGKDIPVATVQKLEAYSYFDRELWLRIIDWLPDKIIGCCLNAENGITVLHINMHGLTLSHFTLTGDKISAHHIEVEDELILIGGTNINVASMTWRKGHFYLAMGERVLRIGQNGQIDFVSLGAHIQKITFSNYNAALRIAVITEDGCLMVTPHYKEMKITSKLFAQDIDRRDIKIMTDNRLVISGEKSAYIYELTGDTPSLKALIETENEIMQIVAIPKRHHCAFLEKDNRISIYQLNE